MKCDFCGHEVDKGTVECPYCHYRFKIDAQVLSPEERDTFEGVTIDEGAVSRVARFTRSVRPTSSANSRYRLILRCIPLAAAVAC